MNFGTSRGYSWVPGNRLHEKYKISLRFFKILDSMTQHSLWWTYFSDCTTFNPPYLLTVRFPTLIVLLLNIKFEKDLKLARTLFSNGTQGLCNLLLWDTQHLFHSLAHFSFSLSGSDLIYDFFRCELHNLLDFAFCCINTFLKCVDRLKYINFHVLTEGECPVDYQQSLTFHHLAKWL